MRVEFRDLRGKMNLWMIFDFEFMLFRNMFYFVAAKFRITKIFGCKMLHVFCFIFCNLKILFERYINELKKYMGYCNVIIFILIA